MESESSFDEDSEFLNDFFDKSVDDDVDYNNNMDISNSDSDIEIVRESNIFLRSQLDESAINSCTDVGCSTSQLKRQRGDYNLVFKFW